MGHSCRLTVPQLGRRSILEMTVCSAKSGETDASVLIASGFQKLAETKNDSPSLTCIGTFDTSDIVSRCRVCAVVIGLCVP